MLKKIFFLVLLVLVIGCLNKKGSKNNMNTCDSISLCTEKSHFTNQNDFNRLELNLEKIEFHHEKMELDVKINNLSQDTLIVKTLKDKFDPYYIYPLFFETFNMNLDNCQCEIVDSYYYNEYMGPKKEITTLLPKSYYKTKSINFHNSKFCNGYIVLFSYSFQKKGDSQIYRERSFFKFKDNKLIQLARSR